MIKIFNGKSRIMALMLCLALIASCTAFSFAAQTDGTAPLSIANDEEGIDLYIVSEAETTDGFTCQLAFDIEADNSERGIKDTFYVNFGFGSTGGKITATAWYDGTYMKHDLEMALYAGDTSGSTKIVSKKTSALPSSPNSFKVDSAPTATKFWKVTITGTVNGVKISTLSSPSLLFSKKAACYPNLYDCFGNIKMRVPA